MRFNIYPFNKAVSIKLISFKETQLIPVKNKVLDAQKVLEQVELTNEQKDSLTNLLYNVGFTPVAGAKRSFFGEASCYEPRNGILFIDSSGKVFEYLEICFACHRIRKSSSMAHFGEFCSTKYDMLKEFLFNTGIKYGTVEQNPITRYDSILKLDTSDAITAISTKLAKKTANGTNLNQLNEIERHLFFLINAKKIYDGEQLLSGLAQFYSSISGNYYQQTVDVLKESTAYCTVKVIEASRLQWPSQKIPTDMAMRRRVLFSIINNADAHWRKLEKGLYNYDYQIGAVYLIPKESLNKFIYRFVNLHRNELSD